MFQETYIFVTNVFTFESFNFNILIFDQEIGLYKPFNFCGTSGVVVSKPTFET
jgi:hypothetical protein